MDLILHPTKNLVGVVKPAVNAAQLESDFLPYHMLLIMMATAKVFGRNLKKYLMEPWEIYIII